jgi:hypothetical protein
MEIPCRVCVESNSTSQVPLRHLDVKQAITAAPMRGYRHSADSSGSKPSISATQTTTRSTLNVQRALHDGREHVYVCYTLISVTF